MGNPSTWLRARLSTSVDSLIAVLIAVAVTKATDSHSPSAPPPTHPGGVSVMDAHWFRLSIPVAAAICVYWLGRWRGARNIRNAAAASRIILYRSGDRWPDVVAQPSWRSNTDPANATSEKGRGTAQRSGRRLLIRRDNTVNRLAILLQDGYLDQPATHGQYVEKDPTVSGSRWIKVSFKAQALAGAQTIQIIAQRTRSLDNAYLRQSRPIHVEPVEQRVTVELDLHLNDNFFLHIDSIGASEPGAEIALWDFVAEDTSQRSK